MLSTFLTFFGVFLCLMALCIAPYVLYQLKDSAKLMVEGTGYNET
jgi:hypothetical protein